MSFSNVGGAAAMTCAEANSSPAITTEIRERCILQYTTSGWQKKRAGKNDPGSRVAHFVSTTNCKKLQEIGTLRLRGRGPEDAAFSGAVMLPRKRGVPISAPRVLNKNLERVLFRQDSRLHDAAVTRYIGKVTNGRILGVAVHWSTHLKLGVNERVCCVLIG